MDNPTYLEPLNKDEALQKQAEMDELLTQISVHELRLSKIYARLGSKLREVKAQQYWIALGYERFSSYLEFIRGKIGRERSQVYAILSVAENLLPLMSESDLEAVGITRAHELRRLVNEGGSVEASVTLPLLGDGEESPTVRIMDYAMMKGVTSKQLRVKVNELLHIHEDVSGLWFDVGGFYASPDERKEIDQFWELGRKVLQLTGEQPEHTWKKEVFLAAARESISTWVNTGWVDRKTGEFIEAGL